MNSHNNKTYVQQDDKIWALKQQLQDVIIEKDKHVLESEAHQNLARNCDMAMKEQIARLKVDMKDMISFYETEINTEQMIREDLRSQLMRMNSQYENNMDL